MLSTQLKFIVLATHFVWDFLSTVCIRKYACKCHSLLVTHSLHWLKTLSNRGVWILEICIRVLSASARFTSTDNLQPQIIFVPRPRIIRIRSHECLQLWPTAQPISQKKM